MSGRTCCLSAVKVTVPLTVGSSAPLQRVWRRGACVGAPIRLCPLCELCRERASRGWSKARWARRYSGQMSARSWRVIRHDLREVQVDGVRSPGVPSVVLPVLVWWAALDGDFRILWMWHRRGGLATQ